MRTITALNVALAGATLCFVGLAQAAEPPPAPTPVEAPSATLLADDGPLTAPITSTLRAASVLGPIGLDRIWSADPGELGTVRLRYSYRFFEASDWPMAGYDNSFKGSDLSLSWTPLPYLETFGSVRSTSNVNHGSHPALLQTQGDLTLGVKGGHYFNKSTALGVAVAAHLLGGLGQGDLLGDGTSFEIRALATQDLQRAGVAPIRGYFDASFYFENSEHLTSDRDEELDVAQEWGLQVARYDRLVLGFGVEAPFDPRWSPYLEYRVGTPFLVELDRIGEGAHEFEFGSIPHTLTPGLRAFPVDNLAIDVAVRIGLSDVPATGVPATPPWEAVFALSYTLDPGAQRAPAPAPVEVAAAPTRIQLKGQVTDAKTGQPIRDARVMYAKALGLTPQITGKNGRFAGYETDPGPIKVRVKAPRYKTIDAAAEAIEGQTVQLAITMERDLTKVTFSVVVLDARGRRAAAAISVGGEVNLKGKSTAKTPFTGTATPGTWPVTVTAKGLPPVDAQLVIVAGTPAKLKVRLPAPIRRATAPAETSSLVTFKDKRLTIKRKIRFKKGSEQISGSSTEVLAALAKVLRRHKKITKIKISVHTDNRGEPSALRKLSKARAKSVKSFLTARGVSADRIKARGYGSKKPVAPNLTTRGRQKNNRVTIEVLEVR